MWYASAFTGDKACASFCSSLYGSLHIIGATKRSWRYVFIHYSKYIMYTSSPRRQEQTICWPWMGSLIPSSSKYKLFHRIAASRCEICARLCWKKISKKEKGEREKTGNWGEKATLEISLTPEGEHGHDVKAKEEHALHSSIFRALLNVNAWDDSQK